MSDSNKQCCMCPGAICPGINGTLHPYPTPCRILPCDASVAAKHEFPLINDEGLTPCQVALLENHHITDTDITFKCIFSDCGILVGNHDLKNATVIATRKIHTTCAEYCKFLQRGNYP